MERPHIPQPDTDFMDIDEDLVVPDTPDRVFTQHKNIFSRTSISASLNPKNNGLADRGVFGRKSQAFGDSLQHSGVCASFGSSGGDVDQIQDSRNHIVRSSLFRNVEVPNVASSRTFKQQGSPSFDNWLKDERFSCTEFLGQSNHHGSNNGPVLAKEGKFEGAPNSTFVDSSMSIKHGTKGKVRIDNDRPTHHVTHHKKSNDSICNVASERATAKGISMPSQSARLPCKDSTKRLAQNRRMSPHNIAKGKQLAGSSVSVSTDACGNGISGSSNSLADVNEVIGKDYGAIQAKGKGIVTPTISSNGHEGRRSATGRFSELWRKGKIQETDSIFGNDKFSSASTMGACSSSFSPAVLEPVTLLNEDQVRTPSTTIKKQKQHDCALSSLGKSTEVICLSSCGESSAERSRRAMNSCSPIAVGELSSEVRESESDAEAEARATQLHLDEMLARELQEQLYNEIPEAATGESSRGHASARQRRAGMAPNTETQPQSGSSRSRLNRRGPPAWFNTSSIARLRNRVNRGSSLISSEEREMFSPAEMDFDMRVELLERLQAFFNEDVGMFNQLLDSDREFDENDYEMLLALDENNHVHLGASTAQIANLPESTVHNDSFEACSICLETPVIGDTIRHLPCLHKFHKDCIDPWLRRKRSCPVCKSDI